MDSLPPATSEKLVVIHNIDPSTSTQELTNLMALELIKGLKIAIDALEVLGELGYEHPVGVNLWSLEDVHDAARAFQREVSK
jgi:hypothetical protein